jgi:hypothetical protein
VNRFDHVFDGLHDDRRLEEVDFMSGVGDDCEA